jgi:hypothetical protein
MRRGRKKGQVLVIAAFGMALILLSTQVYIFKVKRGQSSSDHDFLGDYVLDIKLGSDHAVVASLINVSNGGPASILGDNLERWEVLVAGDYRFGRCDLNSTLASQPPYSQGLWLDWGNEGVGLSSASSYFNLNIGGRGVDVNLDFDVNVTTTVLLSGGFSVLGGDSKAVTVYLNLLNEGRPALHGSTTLTYQRTPGQWADPTVLDDYSAVDYGNGTYRYSFSDSIEGETVSVRVQTYDLRGVFVQAEATLTEG